METTMIGAHKAISQRSHMRTRAQGLGIWLAGAALAFALVAAPHLAEARDHDGGGRRGGSNAEGRSVAGRGDGDRVRNFGNRESGGRAFSGRTREAGGFGDRGTGERRFGNRNSGVERFAERGRSYGGRDVAERRGDGQRFDDRRFDSRRFDGRRFDGGRRSYGRPYYSRGYGGWRGSRWWGPSTFIGFGSYYDDYRAWPYYGLAAWELAEYANLSEQQVRAQEDAMIAATSAPLNDPIAWNDGAASGSVTPLRDGQTDDGRTCREFQQEITVDGKRQRAYGTACREPDGSWEMVEK